MTTVDDEITHLRAELASLRAEVAALTHAGSRPIPTGRVSRAGLLRAAGLAAAGAAAGAMILPSATPALADNGANLVAGQDNQATAVTSLTSSVLTDAALRVSNYYTGEVDDYSDALQAYTYGAGLAAVYGRNDAPGGSGVIGYSGNGIGGTFAGGLAPLRLQPATSAGAPAAGIHQQGELSIDANGSLWICTASGTPGTWVGAGGMVTIGEYIADGTDTVVSFGSIPQTYRHLKIIAVGRTDVSSSYDHLTLELNGDVGNNYRMKQGYSSGSGGWTISDNTTSGPPSVAELAGGSTPTGQAAATEVTIYHYGDTTFWKNIESRSMRPYDDLIELNYIAWMNSAAVNSLTLTATGHLQAGSVVSLYGV